VTTLPSSNCAIHSQSCQELGHHVLSGVVSHRRLARQSTNAHGRCKQAQKHPVPSHCSPSKYQEMDDTQNPAKQIAKARGRCKQAHSTHRTYLSKDSPGLLISLLVAPAIRFLALRRALALSLRRAAFSLRRELGPSFLRVALRARGPPVQSGLARALLRTAYTQCNNAARLKQWQTECCSPLKLSLSFRNAVRALSRSAVSLWRLA
jgi:hypothetical protein